MIYKDFEPKSSEWLRKQSKAHLLRHIKDAYEAMYDLLLYKGDIEKAGEFYMEYPLSMDWVKTMHNLKAGNDDKV